MAGLPKDAHAVVRLFFPYAGQLNLKRREVNIYEYCQKSLAGKDRICLDDQA